MMQTARVILKHIMPQGNITYIWQCLTRSSPTGVLQVQGCSPAKLLLESSISSHSMLASGHLPNSPKHFTLCSSMV